MMRAKAALLASLTMATVLCPTVAFALPFDRLPSQYVHRQWDETSGLPQNSVFAIARDGESRLFLATEEGLVEWNGRRFRIHDKREHSALTTSAIRAMISRPTGGVWVTTLSGDVCSFDGVRFDCLARRAPLPEQIALTLALDGDAILAGGSNGLLRIESPETTPRIETISTRFCAAVLATEHGVWMGGPDGLIARDRDGRERVISSSPVTALASDERTRTLLLANGEGVHRALESGEIQLLIPYDETGPVHALSMDIDGSLYVASERGLFHRSPDGLLARLSNEARVLSVFSWDAHHVFFGGAFSGFHMLYAGTAIPFGDEEGLPFGPTSVVEVATDGSLWVGTFGGEVFRIRIAERQSLVAGRWDSEGDHTIGAVVAIEPLSGSSALIGTARGLFRVSERGVELLESTPVLAIAAQSTDVFVSFENPRIERYSLANPTDQLVSRGSISLPLGSREDSGYRALLILDDGTLFAGGPHLVRVAAGERAAELIPIDHARLIYSLVHDTDGTLWIGTAYDGLFRLRNGRVERLTIREGLHDDTFFSLAPSRENEALVGSSNRGIAVYSRDALEDAFRNRSLRSPWVIDARDGMRSRECNGPGGGRDASGGLWFPTARGVVFVPDVPSISPRPSVAIQGIVMGRDRPSSFEERPRGANDVIRLSPDADGFELELAMSPLVLAPWSRYQYSISLLHPQDESEFIDIGDESHVHLLRPSPGTYSVRVRAIGRDGLPGSTSEIRIRAEPHWYEEMWIRGLALALCVSALAWAIRVRGQRAKRRQAELEHLVTERTQELRARSESLADALDRLSRMQADLLRAERLATTAILVRGIAHELRNPLGMISGNIRVLARYTEYLLRVGRTLRERATLGVDEQRALRLSAKKDFEDVASDLPALLADTEEGLRRTTLIVNDLGDLDRGVEARAIENTSIERAIANARRTLEHRMSALPDMEVECDAGTSVDTYAGLIEQILTNLLANAIDAVTEAPPSEGAPIAMAVHSTEDEGVEISIADRGPGMSPEVLTRAMEPFFTTKPAGRGTGLGLAITAALVRSAGGQIAIASERGRGTTVTFFLPSLSVGFRRSLDSDREIG